MMIHVITLVGILLALFGVLKKEKISGKILLGLGIIITILSIAYFIYAINMPVR